MGCRPEDDIPAISSISTEWSTIWDIFFSPPGYSTISSSTSSAGQYDFIDKHKKWKISEKRKMRLYRLFSGGVSRTI
jgi:hypothetical protein